MKTNHRIRRSTKQPQPGSPGAAFTGIFRVFIQPDITGAASIVGAVYFVPPDIMSEVLPAWVPNATIDADAFIIIADGVRVAATTATVNAQGTEINIVHPAGGISLDIVAVPGHPGLQAANGTQCGGALGAA